ncbi:MAG: HWE histidine kinase domain-containing protein [Reyranella sp.]|uniref:sensor histidine kinase n=1 Tax=Reyranella sp. TaxID=1929291 RepID=UPI0027310C6F|nr:HWE histidine kinase domain-containing protein [Reyranella sp.]MDP1961058.1 HWE histidine kinase domain-containing protein [Reyranella sp.]MDP2375868.1 HWE histidine kinase domain-containing protein [Reyranella sp.]
MAEPQDQRELETILEGIGEAFYSLDRDWRIVHFNAEAAKHFQRPASETVGRRLWDVFPMATDTDLGRLFRDTMARRATVRGEAMSVVVGPRWLAYRLFPLGDGMGIVFRDITDLKSAEEHRELLINELNHRVKNTLTMVQSIAAQTFRGTDAGVRADFEQRLLTLSNVHNLLTEESWDGAELHAVIRSSLRPHMVDGRNRITLEGPDFRLRPKSAVALSMALHELATNALKYGALSAEAGRVALHWRTDDGRFHLRWEESGGPPVTPPCRTGFGSRMIERGLSAEFEGEVKIDYRPAGVVCTIDAPLDVVRDEGAAN